MSKLTNIQKCGYVIFQPKIYVFELKMRNLVIIFLFFNLTFTITLSKKSKDGSKPDWAKKDIRDYSDADMERLLEQWEASSQVP